MLSPLHRGGRNYTCTEIKLSKIILISVPYPPQIVSLWFQGNGSHLEGRVRPTAYGAPRHHLSLCFLHLGFVPDRPCPLSRFYRGPSALAPLLQARPFGLASYSSAPCGLRTCRRTALQQGGSGGSCLRADSRRAAPQLLFPFRAAWPCSYTLSSLGVHGD
jgi:hypothetical protein